MEFVELMQTNWNWIASNPWGFVMFVLLSAGGGWIVARILYHERLELLKTLAGERKTGPTGTSPVKTITYDAQGRHGRNILANSTHDARLGEAMSLQANVPQESRLNVILHGPPPTSLSDTISAWSFVSVPYWKHSTYQETTRGSIQHFNAEGGRADLEFVFCRPGEVTIEAFEDNSKVASWSKRIHVVEVGNA